MQQILSIIKDADVFDRLTADTPLELKDGTVIQIPPHPQFGLLGDDQLDAYEELVFEAESYDREDDVVVRYEVKRADGTVIPARTAKGPLKVPHQKDGKAIKPTERVRVAKAALGEEAYAKLKAAGNNASDVWKIWAVQGAEFQEYLAAQQAA